MRTSFPALVVIVFSLSIAPCVAGEEAGDAAAASQATYERLVRVTTDYQLLLEAVGKLKPEVFEAVGLYRIEPGDTGMKIAKKHGITIPELQALNPEVDWQRLRVWQVVRVRPESQEVLPHQLPEAKPGQGPADTQSPSPGAPQR